MSTSVLVRGTLHQRHSHVPTNDATNSHRLHSIERVSLMSQCVLGTSVFDNQTDSQASNVKVVQNVMQVSEILLYTGGVIHYDYVIEVDITSVANQISKHLIYQPLETCWTIHNSICKDLPHR